jgi:F-type H+-transporting ATPase subunit gamma
MAKLKEIRTRIASVKNTRQVTSAMKMVSAAKLKRAQDAIMQIAPYDRELHKIIQDIHDAEFEKDNIFYTEFPIEKALVVVVGSNRGLCGSFNSNAVKHAVSHALTNYKETTLAGNTHFFVIGRQIETHLKTMGATIEGEFNDLITDICYGKCSLLTEKLKNLFITGQYQRIDIVYNKFKNAAVQELTAEQYLPIPNLDRVISPIAYTTDYIYEPTKQEVFASLVPLWLYIQIFRIMLDSNTAEQGARMTAMHQATDNADEMLKNLHAQYNNARQTAITNEILEITAGAEALKNK